MALNKTRQKCSLPFLHRHGGELSFMALFGMKPYFNGSVFFKRRDPFSPLTDHYAAPWSFWFQLEHTQPSRSRDELPSADVDNTIRNCTLKVGVDMLW